jgi:hypothetical protein
MATKGKTDNELWRALSGLDDDLLDIDLPEGIVDDELKALQVDPTALAKRGGEFVTKAKEEERLSWQVQARERQAVLRGLASRAGASALAGMDRDAMLARLEELRSSTPSLGTAIRMAARKRKPEESTEDELRLLLQEMEALRAIESGEPE